MFGVQNGKFPVDVPEGLLHFVDGVHVDLVVDSLKRRNIGVVDPNQNRVWVFDLNIQ